MFVKTRLRQFFAFAFVVAATSLSVISLAGCERKETILDVQTPGADVEVERNIDTGEVDVEATDQD
jgi:hypothetical protein